MINTFWLSPYIIIYLLYYLIGRYSEINDLVRKPGDFESLIFTIVYDWAYWSYFGPLLNNPWYYYFTTKQFLLAYLITMPISILIGFIFTVWSAVLIIFALPLEILFIWPMNLIYFVGW